MHADVRLHLLLSYALPMINQYAKQRDSCFFRCVAAKYFAILAQKILSRTNVGYLYVIDQRAFNHCF